MKSNDLTHILVLDDETSIRDGLIHYFSERNYRISGASNWEEAQLVLPKSIVHIIILDVVLPGFDRKKDGLDVLSLIKQKYPDTEVIMISGHATVEKVITAWNQGALMFLEKPYSLEEMEKAVKRAEYYSRGFSRLHQLEAQVISQKMEQSLGTKVIAKSPQMKKCLSLAKKYAQNNHSVLITGESGTGKEIIAKLIHYFSNRSEEEFVAVNVNAIPHELFESTLFGYVKGAFTGANTNTTGLVEKAGKGTIFLDEIGDISPAIQLKLLRVLQEKTFERVGDAVPLKVDVRVIAATNRDLKEKVRKGEFREDLYYRLKVVEIMLPRLNERLEDIPLLVEHFCSRFNKSFNKSITGIADEVLAVFMNYDWPGNIRELEHAIEHAFVLCHGQEITCEHLPQEIKELCDDTVRTSETSREITRDSIISALQKCGWNKAKAARTLGVSRQTMYRKISEFNISEQTSKNH